jgi:twitching motility protein PilT
VNLLRDHHGVSAVLRHIPNTIFTLEELGMPEILRKWCEAPKGLVLITGPTGSGKSTTLAAMIDHINRTEEVHILTIEDPIEFVHQSKKALVNQRGEMRDLETISMALETANTGHLVMGTLHTATAMSTVDRIIDQFPAESQEQIRSVLADNLLGVCCQTLCRKIGGGRIPALEILAMDYATANQIREGKTQMLASTMATGKARGNRLLCDDLVRLVQQDKITKEEALSNSVDQREMAKRLGLSKE